MAVATLRIITNAIINYTLCYLSILMSVCPIILSDRILRIVNIEVRELFPPSGNHYYTDHHEVTIKTIHPSSVNIYHWRAYPVTCGPKEPHLGPACE